MKEYLIMGSSAGDGGFVFAKNHLEAFLKFMGDSVGKENLKELKKELKENNVKTKKVSSKKVIIGDYEIIEVTKK